MEESLEISVKCYSEESLFLECFRSLPKEMQ